MGRRTSRSKKIGKNHLVFYVFMGERYIFDKPRNTKVKCLCVIVVDVSGSMEIHMPAVNDALQSFYSDILDEKNGVTESTKKQLEVALIQFDQEYKTLREACLLKDGEVPPTLTTRGSTTESVKALEEALDIVESRKRFYERTGQRFYRPWIIFITDGEPYTEGKSQEEIQREVDKLGARISTLVEKRHLYILGLSVQGEDERISEQTLKKLTANNYQELKDSNFKKFFSWLSRSVSTLVKSRVEDGFTPDSNEFN